MDRKKALIVGAGGAVGLAAIAAAAFALAPDHRGLAGLDANNDGRIVTAEIQQGARQRFAELDSNRDGRLSAEEMPRGRHGRGRGRHGGHHEGFEGDMPTPPAAAPAPSAPTEATRNMVAAAPLPQAPVPAAAPARRHGLASADVDGDGALDLREFYRQFSARIARADANGDGTVTTEELEARRGRRHGRGH